MRVLTEICPSRSLSLEFIPNIKYHSILNWSNRGNKTFHKLCPILKTDKQMEYAIKARKLADFFSRGGWVLSLLRAVHVESLIIPSHSPSTFRYIALI